MLAGRTAYVLHDQVNKEGTQKLCYGQAVQAETDNLFCDGAGAIS